MLTHHFKFKQVLWALLLPLIGTIPFLAFLRRDFAAFQSLDPQGAAMDHAVPWSWERAIASLASVVCVAWGLFWLGHRSFANAWLRLLMVWGCILLLALLLYLCSPKGYFRW